MSNTDTITAWTEAAKFRTADNPPDLKPLCDALAGGFFINPRVDGKDEQGRSLIAFETRSPNKDETPKTRYMLPVHATITRVLELAGTSMRLDHVKGRNVYKVKLHLRDKGRGQLLRILFNVPDDGELRELYGGDYQSFTPPQYVVVKRWAAAPFNRNLLLKAIRARHPDLADLLEALFDIADLWHGSELLGNSPRPPAEIVPSEAAE